MLLTALAPIVYRSAAAFNAIIAWTRHVGDTPPAHGPFGSVAAHLPARAAHQRTHLPTPADAVVLHMQPGDLGRGASRAAAVPTARDPRWCATRSGRILGSQPRLLFRFRPGRGRMGTPALRSPFSTVCGSNPSLRPMAAAERPSRYRAAAVEISASLIRRTVSIPREARCEPTVCRVTPN